MGSSRRALVATLALVLSLPVAADARAQPHEPTPQELESAANLYKQGKELRAQGDILGALEKLRAAHALGNTPVTGIELARTYVVVSKLVEARQVCLGVIHLPVAPDETEKSATARLDAQQLADELKPRIPTLVVKVSGASPGEPVHMIIDGAPVPDAALNEPQKVDPGRHEVVVRAGVGPTAREARASTQIDESQTGEVAVVLPPAPEVPPDQLPPEETKSRWSPLAIIGFSVTGAGVVVGTVAGLFALSKANQLPGLCPNNQCDNTNGGIDTLHAAQTGAHISEVGVEVAAVGAAFGIAGLLIGRGQPASQPPPPSSGAVSVKPWVSFGAAGVHGSF
jgi:hypothetical protein